jgi:hypothetical protein
MEIQGIVWPNEVGNQEGDDSVIGDRTSDR